MGVSAERDQGVVDEPEVRKTTEGRFTEPVDLPSRAEGGDPLDLAEFGGGFTWAGDSYLTWGYGRDEHEERSLPGRQMALNSTETTRLYADRTWAGNAAGVMTVARGPGTPVGNICVCCAKS